MLLTLTVNIGEPTFSVCCRRNMAAFEAKQADTTATGNPKLQLVTWLEPLFVGSVDITQISTGDALSLLNSQIHYYSMARLDRWFTFRHSRNTWASATSIIEKNRTMALKSPCMGTITHMSLKRFQRTLRFVSNDYQMNLSWNRLATKGMRILCNFPVV